MTARRTFWARLLAIVGILSVTVFAPYKSTTSPGWEIQVVGSDGVPVPNFPVRQEWSYLGIDIAPWVDNRQTDAQGRVVFPRRVIWPSIASRILNFEGSSKPGPSVWIEACDDHSMMGEFFWDGNRFALGGSATRTARIVVKPSKHCTFT